MQRDKANRHFFIKIIVYAFLCFMGSACYRSTIQIQSTEIALDRVSKRLKTDQAASMAGANNFWLGDSIPCFNITFEVPKKNFELPQARAYFINFVENFLAMMNEQPEMRQHLGEYQIAPDSLTLAVCFVDKNKAKPSWDKIAMIWIAEGDIYYATRIEEFPYFELYEKENYLRAKRIVDQAKNKVLPELVSEECQPSNEKVDAQQESEQRTLESRKGFEPGAVACA